MLDYLRRKGPKLHLFRPIEDLSIFSGNLHKGALTGISTLNGASELEKYVIKSRQGTVLVSHTILKIDHWAKDNSETPSIDGATNFRKVEAMDVYGVSQPTIQGISNIVHKILSEEKTKKIIWINLREEPLIYVNSSAYVLRDKYFTLRNIKSYSGITAPRLEYIEDKLREDVLVEISTYDNRILLHGETPNGEIIPIWEDAYSENVLTIAEAMKRLKDEKQPVDYYRIPLTPEAPPDENDFDQILEIISKADLKDTSIVLYGFIRFTLKLIISGIVKLALGDQRQERSLPAWS